MTGIFKKPLKFQSHFTQNLMWNTYLSLVSSDAESKIVQKTFNKLVTLTLQFMNYQTILFFGSFLDRFVKFIFNIFAVDFKIFVKLSNAFFTFTSSSSLSSLRPSLVFLKILIFRGDILKNVYKRIQLF